MTDNRLLNAFDAWEEPSQSPESIIAYQSRLKIMIDEEAKLDYAEHKGLEKGLAQGLEQGLEQGRGQGAENTKKEIIHSGIKQGFDIPTLAKLTGYSEERVREIIEEV